MTGRSAYQPDDGDVIISTELLLDRSRIRVCVQTADPEVDSVMFVRPEDAHAFAQRCASQSRARVWRTDNWLRFEPVHDGSTPSQPSGRRVA